MYIWLYIWYSYMHDILPWQKFSLHPILPVFVLPVFVDCGTADGSKRGPTTCATLFWFALSKALTALFFKSTRAGPISPRLSNWRDFPFAGSEIWTSKYLQEIQKDYIIFHDRIKTLFYQESIKYLKISQIRLTFCRFWSSRCVLPFAGNIEIAAKMVIKRMLIYRAICCFIKSPY